MIGVTSMDPSHAIKQPSASKLMTSTLVANGKKFTVNGNEVIFYFCHIRPKLKARFWSSCPVILLSVKSAIY